MALPKVVIIGRPNVGKSSLFNWLAGRKIAIVDDMAGVTRDRVGTLVQIGSDMDPRFIEEVAHRLRYLKTPVILVMNKADHPSLDDRGGEFYKLGRGKPVAISTHQNR